MSEETADAEEERRSTDQRGRNPVEKAERAGEESRDSVREQNTVKKARTDKHS